MLRAKIKFGFYKDRFRMRIIVTGADGFVGGYLIAKLQQHNHKLLLIGGNLQLLLNRYGRKVICVSHLSLHQNELKIKIEKFSPDIVIHLATYYTVSDEYADMEKLFSANILFLGKILDALKYTHVKCFIYTGSCTEYYKGDGFFDPAYLYSATKTAGRFILNYYSDIYNYKYISLTPYTVYGDVDTRKKIIDLFYDSLNALAPLDTTQGNQILDFIHVSDLTDLFLQIVANVDKIPHKSNFQAGTGIGHSLRHLVEYMEKESGTRANINWGGLPYRKKDTMYAVADISLQKNLLNWFPKISLSQGVKLYIEAKSAQKVTS